MIKIGDYVWFNAKNDIFCGHLFADESTRNRPGKIAKMNDELGIIWVAPIRFTSGSALPLWAIPDDKIKLMENTEAMLALLEN